MAACRSGHSLKKLLRINTVKKLSNMKRIGKATVKKFERI